jgi:putative membrane-bound dehydrogenase-like protein
MISRHPVAIAAALCGVVLTVGAADEFPKAFNTENPDAKLTTPQAALAGMKVPDGFEISLFAAEPDVQQPIAISTDDRGRLWVVENYSYAERATNFEDKLRDRIIILEDTDRDGRFDERKVFWDQGRRLTSVEIGHGGVWVTDAPNLLFIPDRDGDDVPDGEPVVMLDGWDDDAIRHNIVNGLRWGPDGWLYGRHGIMATSLVGSPDASPDQRTPINCGIWRFHPTKHKFEVVCHGGTNAWGMDWDANGQLFYINTVIGHLWHVVPGARYRRMYGEHFNPHTYGVIEQTADHFHWDTSHAWHETKKTGITPDTDAAGGGHAHSGMVIVPPGLWQKEYDNCLFTVNLHGQRINSDRLVREDCSYVGQHRPDFLLASDPWFRAVELHFGRHGELYVADWSDVGECHENDGVHRSSGRIYRITWTGREDSPRDDTSLAELDPSALFGRVIKGSEWESRHALRLLSERAAEFTRPQIDGFLSRLGVNPAAMRRGGGPRGGIRMLDTRRLAVGRDGLRMLWALNAINALNEPLLRALLDHPDEHMKVQAIQLLVDGGHLTPRVLEKFDQLAENDQSGLVLLWLASSLQKMPHGFRWPLASLLANREEHADDRVFPLMLWFGVESAVPSFTDQAIAVVDKGRIPLLREFIARRLTAEIERQPEAVSKLLWLTDLHARDVDRQLDILRGSSEALRGWRKASPPPDWTDISAKLASRGSDEIKRHARELSLVFGDGRALIELHKVARGSAPLNERRAAIRALVLARDKDVVPLLKSLLGNRDMAQAAINGLAAFDDKGTAPLLVSRFGGFRHSAKREAINTLVSRPNYTATLLAAIDGGQIGRSSVSAFQIRQMQSFENATISEQVQQLWPELEQLTQEKADQMVRLRKQLTPKTLAQADLSMGRWMFAKSCANCHKLFGEGKTIGPELTGAQRNNVNYLLENIVDPSATVSKNFQMTIVLLDDGRVFNGVIVGRAEKTITLQTGIDRVVIPRDDIDEMRDSKLSMMPENQLKFMSDEQIRDLMGYLMSPSQVPLPDAPQTAAVEPDGVKNSSGSP